MKLGGVVSLAKKIIYSILFFGLTAFLFPQNAFGGAWTVPQYKVWGEYSFKWSWSKDDYGPGPDQQRDRKSNSARSWGWTMEPKLEYGVTDWFNLLFSMEYKEQKYKEYDRPPAWGPFRRKNHGLTSIKIGGKMRFLKDPLVVSGLLKVHIYPGYGNYNGDDPAFRHQPSIGDGEDMLELRALFGKELYVPIGQFFGDSDYKLKCYGGLETGYRFKNRDVNNDIPFLIEGGIWPLKWLLVKTEVDGVWSHDGTGNVEKDYAIWRIGPVFQILAGDAITKQGKMFNIEVQYGRTFWGRNTSDDQEIILKAQSQF